MSRIDDIRESVDLDSGTSSEDAYADRAWLVGKYDRLEAECARWFEHNSSLTAENKRWQELCSSMLIHIQPGAGLRRATIYEAEYNDLISTQPGKADD